MASCVLRRTVLLGLRKVNANKKPCQLRKINQRLIYTSSTLLEKYYAETHEWVDIPKGQDVGTVGITDYAQDKLGDVVFIQLPDMGQVLEAGTDAGVLESVKAASDICSPVSGEVTDVNNEVAENPALINQEPYGQGWLYKLKLSDPEEVESLVNDGKLMSEAGYKEFLESQE